MIKANKNQALEDKRICVNFNKASMDLDENNKQSTGGLSLKPLSSITLLKYIQIVTYSSFFGVSVVLLITQTIQSVNVYLQGPTYTETLLHDQENTTFPVLTICPLENPYKEDVLKVMML